MGKITMQSVDQQVKEFNDLAETHGLTWRLHFTSYYEYYKLTKMKPGRSVQWDFMSGLKLGECALIVSGMITAVNWMAEAYQQDGSDEEG